MHRWTRARALTAAGALALTGLSLSSQAAVADSSHADPAPKAYPAGTADDIRPDSPDLNGGKTLPLDKAASRQAIKEANRDALRGRPMTIGQQKTWLANDDTDGSVYLKRYTLRGVGKHVQVWVANDRAFPLDDCRNDLGTTDITDTQVHRFVNEFDHHMYPIESKVFSKPPRLDGSHSQIAGPVLDDPNYYKVGKKQSDDIVVLVDNVRDANFYDPTTPDGQTYIAGFFSSQFNDYTGRNVMTIDAFDWRHRTGATPPDDSSDPAWAKCGLTGKPRAHDYEGTFAHEYQHLLEHYKDSDEVSWVNEGLSDWAQTATGYVNPDTSPKADDADSHIGCFQGYLPESYGGPENSLTRWGDQGGPEILCDYGAAYSFMEYLDSHFGDDFMSALHRAKGNGLVGLDAVLDEFGKKMSAQTLLHRWAASMALDHVVDRNGHRLVGGGVKPYTTASLKARIKWGNPQAYDTPGAPSNGADYVRLRDAAGKFLTAGDLDSIDFSGAATLPTDPVAWKADSTPPDSVPGDADGNGTCDDVNGGLPDGAGPAALWSDCGDELDNSIVRQVTVPADNPTLSFDTLYDIEEGWDFGMAQVSTDGGASWKSLALTDATSDHDPDAEARITAQLPGLTGSSDGWTTEQADLSDYAGKQVLISFRYMTDAAYELGGFWVRNVKVGDTALPTDSLDGWKSITQTHPVAVSGYTVQLVGLGGRKAPAYHKTLKLDGSFHGSLSGDAIAKALGKSRLVGAIVMYDDPTELSTKYAPYTLTANGVTQPGGGQD